MNEPKKEKSYTENQVLTKIYSYCTYQERTQTEVRKKLYDWGIKKDVTEEIISKLIEENFLNEERFAKTYAGGKFRIKHWGRKKIITALKQKEISDYCIKAAMKEIPEDDYLATLKKLLYKRSLAEKEKHPLKRKYKLGQYLIAKGYETELVWRLLEEEE